MKCVFFIEIFALNDFFMCLYYTHIVITILISKYRISDNVDYSLLLSILTQFIPHASGVSFMSCSKLDSESGMRMRKSDEKKNGLSSSMDPASHEPPNQ